MNRAQRLQEIVDLLAPQLPAVTPTALLGIVDRVAPQKALFWLHQHIQCHPDALTSGSPVLPAPCSAC